MVKSSAQDERAPLGRLLSTAWSFESMFVSQIPSSFLNLKAYLADI